MYGGDVFNTGDRNLFKTEDFVNNYQDADAIS
jgi:hypothetical protein